MFKKTLDIRERGVYTKNMSTKIKMNIHVAREYAEYLSNDIAKLVPKHPVLKEYFGSVWQEIDAKEKVYNKELKACRIRD